MAAPFLASVAPSPVTVGSPLTITGTVPALAGTSSAAAGGAGNLSVSSLSTCQIVSAVPSSVQAGQPLTITGTTGTLSQIALSGASAAGAGGAGALTVQVPLAGASAAAAGGSAALALRTPAPALFSALPNPVNAGTPLTVSGAVAILSLEGASAAAAGGAGALTVVVPLAGVSAAAAGGAGALAHPVPVPGQLAAGDVESGTASADGTGLVFDPEEWVEFRVDAGAGGRITLLGEIDATAWGQAELLVDSLPEATWGYRGDFDEEERDPMPYKTLTPGTDVPCPLTGSAWTRLDSSPLANRAKVLVLNTHATQRLGIAFTTGAAPAAGSAPDWVIEPDQGGYPEAAAEAIHIWARPVPAYVNGATVAPTEPITARITQFGA